MIEEALNDREKLDEEEGTGIQLSRRARWRWKEVQRRNEPRITVCIFIHLLLPLSHSVYIHTCISVTVCKYVYVCIYLPIAFVHQFNIRMFLINSEPWGVAGRWQFIIFKSTMANPKRRGFEREMRYGYSWLYPAKPSPFRNQGQVNTYIRKIFLLKKNSLYGKIDCFFDWHHTFTHIHFWFIIAMGNREKISL